MSKTAPSTRPTTGTGFLAELEARACAFAEQDFKQHPRWLVKRGDTVLWHLDNKGQRYPYGQRSAELMARWQDTLSKQPFWELGTNYSLSDGKLVQKDPNVVSMILDRQTQLVWQWFAGLGAKHFSEAKTELDKQTYLSLTGWNLPEWPVLKDFRDRSGNPARIGQNYRLYNRDYWLHSTGTQDFDHHDYSRGVTGHIFGFGDFVKKDPLKFWQLMHQKKLQVAHVASGQLLSIPDFAQHNDDWSRWSFAQLWQHLQQEGLTLVLEPPEGTQVPALSINPSQRIQTALLELDYAPCRLPRLEIPQLTDPNKGLWELHGEPAAALAQYGLRPRDPATDIRRQWVAIDFGTSSTVVAIQTPSGGKQLLRVGVQDFYQPIKPDDYENPTVLEFVALEPFLSRWQQEVYRPSLNWDWVRAAHEAKNDLKEGTNDPTVVSSVMLHLKRWALESKDVVVRVSDQQKPSREQVLLPLEALLPVRGSLMEPRPNAPLDVIELYAWYLGMAINTRQHGIHLRYAMTFPVKYPQDIRNKIIASFTRGLQRSLPLSLMQQSDLINDFEVYAVTTEPTAYAAAMLPELGLQPTESGLAYAVFDFGGGTTDFDYGLWRLPTPAEAYDNDAEAILERLGSGGDPYLGGENLLAALAYRVVQDNLSAILAAKVVFTRPEFEALFAGGEAVIDQSSIAQANTAKLITVLRPLLETPEQFMVPDQALDLLSHAKDSKAIELEFKVDELKALIQQRVNDGVRSFLLEMQVAFADTEVTEIQVLLAGNASRGQWVQAAFDKDSDTWMCLQEVWDKETLHVAIHLAQGAQEAGLQRPNCKTATALGALDLVRGTATLQKDRQQSRASSDTPFRYFAGGIRQGHLQPVLLPGGAYQHWQELGMVRDGIFNLAWSESPRARQGMKQGDPAMRMDQIAFATAPKGARCYGRITDPSTIELVAAVGLASLEAGTHDVPLPITLY